MTNRRSKTWPRAWLWLPVLLAAPLLAQEPGAGQLDAGSEELAGAEPAADEPWEDDLDVPEGESYRTPLAGRPLKTEVFGQRIVINARDRGDTLAVTLGATVFTPNIGGNTVIPFFALYYNRVWSERRLRAVVAFLVNDVEFAESLDEEGSFEAIAKFNNSTIPIGMTEVVDGDSVEFSAVEWGHNTAEVGFGLRVKQWPHNLDNDLRIQLLYRASYAYFKSVDETGEIDNVQVAQVNIPPDTYVHGLVGRFSLDMIQRNIMELPHYGFALGGNAELIRRDRWEDTGGLFPSGRPQFAKEDTRDFFRVTAYAYFALPIPPLSERHRLLLSAHGGWMSTNDVDRYNGFRLGGGPPVSESGDLQRSPYPGAMFDQFVAKRYAILSAEYRLEVAFFVYVHLRATIGWAEIPTFSGVANAPFAPVRFQNGRGESFSVGLTSGFLFDSQIYAEYAYDTGSLRAGDDGHMVLLVWSKGF